MSHASGYENWALRLS